MTIGKPERVTQDRVIALDWTDQEGNFQVGESLPNRVFRKGERC
jgi:hypothetical protein